MPASPPLILAEIDVVKTVTWSAVLLAVLIVLFVVVNRYRKWMAADDTPTGPGFTLSDLRRYHKEGKMTDQEFEKAKAILIGSVKAQSAAPPGGPRTKPPGSDVIPPAD
jgi:hypothetical protein